MPDNCAVAPPNIPANTKIGVAAFANADALQEITISVDGKEVVKFPGQGRYNTPLQASPGITYFDSGSGNCRVEIKANGQNSEIFTERVPLGEGGQNPFTVMVITSEDGHDKDCNDAVCLLSWPLG